MRDLSGTSHGRGTSERERFLAVARMSAEAVAAHASRTRDGQLYWRGPESVDGMVVARPLGPYLHPGTAGVALFLAAAARVFKESRYRDLCLAALAPLRREVTEILGEPALALAVDRPLGGMSGLGSLVYALLTSAALLDEPALLRDAQELSRLITPERIAADQNLDAMFGAAGALMTLLALERRAPGPNADGYTPIELASACARHLLDRRTRRAGEPPSWPIGPKSMIAEGGFAHGAAGIAGALLRLHRRTGDQELLQVAREGFAYERSLYRAEPGCWQLSWRHDVRFLGSWCNGAPGIALGRLALPPGVDPESEREREAALAFACAAGLDDDDLVCCGNLGRIDILLAAGAALGDVTFTTAARALAMRVLNRAEERGCFGLMASSRHLFDPRFFLGVSGIGYVFLRLAQPRRIPCVLALD